ncbi:MAG: glycosyltransferase, partial [Methylococcaceae bacterium]
TENKHRKAVINAPGLHVVVAACTCKRPEGLARLLGGLAVQAYHSIDPPQIEILIVDNEGSRVTQTICERFAQGNTGIPINLVNEPVRGISFARNTVLDNVPASCDFLAMIDDDELPDPYWLEQLLITQSTTGYEIIRGPDIPVYPPHTPEWVLEGAYFGWPGADSVLVDGQAMSTSSTSNVLVKNSCLVASGVRFDTELSLTGGEDIVFFNELKKQGCRIGYSAHAVVKEYIPDSRLTRMALMRLSYRYGNNKLSKQSRLNPNGVTWKSLMGLSLSLIVSSLRHIFMGVAYTLRSLLPFYRKRGYYFHGLIRAARGVGQLTSLIGLSYKYYKS